MLVFTESEWLEWWNKVGIFQITSTTTTGGPQVTSKWNSTFSDDQDNLQSSQSTGTVSFMDITKTRDVGHITKIYISRKLRTSFQGVSARKSLEYGKETRPRIGHKQLL